MNQNNLNIMIVAHPDHPYYMEMIKQFTVRTIDEAMNTYETYDWVIDLSPLRTQKKFLFLKEISRTTKAKIITDLTMCWGEWIMKYANVTAAVSTLFYSPKPAFEFSLKDQQDIETKKIIEHFALSLNLKPLELKNLELGFHYPRTIAMIINEAYFALGEKLAGPDDIDLAMKNGVNYPLGPIEWAEKIGTHYVAQLLEELNTITRDERYRLSPALKLLAFKNL